MAIFPPPIPFAEGGPPQSEIKPGDPERELIHEVRNLAQAVSLLNKTYLHKEDFERRSKLMYTIIGVVALVAAVAIASIFVLQSRYHHEENLLVDKLVSSCMTRNMQTQATTEFVHGLLTLNTESARLQPQTAFIKHLEGEYVTLLKNYERGQPPQLNCLSLR